MSEAYLKQLPISYMTWDENVAYFEKLRPEIEKWNLENRAGKPAEAAFYQAILDNDIKTAFSVLIDYETFMIKRQKAPRWLEDWAVLQLPMLRRMVASLPS